MNPRIRILKNRSDIGAGTRGSDLGVDAIEIAAINKNNDFFNRFEYIDIDSHNESVYDKVNNSFGKRIRHVYEQCARVSTAVEQTLADKKYPIVMSGDHSSALGTISGIKAMYPDKKLGVFWIDAHADLHTPYTSPSGNIHGMPLGAAIADDNLACLINDINPETKKYWEKMKNIGIAGRKIEADSIIFFGVRDTEEPEDKQIEKHGIRNFMVHEVRHRGVLPCVNEAIELLNTCDIFYISFDVDSLDCDAVSYGTGTPVQKGFDHLEVIEIINRIIDSNKVVCIEFVEINPLLDNKGNKMAETAFEVLDSLNLNRHA